MTDKNFCGFLDVKITSDGNIRFCGTDEEYNLNDINNVYLFFKHKLDDLYTKMGEDVEELKKKYPGDEPLRYGCIFADITSNCNLRCWFCVNDFNTIKGNTNMTYEMFTKLIDIMPLAADGMFFISCGFEPTIHPHFGQLLTAIPKEQKSKCFFTTNLTLPLSQEMLEIWANSNINNINISIDASSPAVFDELRVGGKFTYFKDNLEKLSNVFRNRSNAPKVRYITVALKNNLCEIPGIIQICRDNYLADEHEIRRPFLFTHSIMGDARVKDLLTDNEWELLKSKISHTHVKFL